MTKAATPPAQLRRGPIRRQAATAAGITDGQLFGPSWRRLFEDVYAWSGLLDAPWLWIAGAALVIGPSGAICGRWAAYLYGVDLLCDREVEVCVPAACTITSRPGLRVRRTQLLPGDLRLIDDQQATSRLRTAFDLARFEGPIEAVVCLDALLHAGLLTVEELRSFLLGRRGWRGVRAAAVALARADARAESPMESRLRMVLLLGGLPEPAVNESLRDASGRFLARPDLRIDRVLIEFDGQIHRDRDVFGKDLRRQNALIDAGFLVLRYTASDVYHRPQVIVAQVRAALLRTGASI